MSSSYEIIELNSENSNSGLFTSYVSVRVKDEKWKNFPACMLPKETIKHLDKIKSSKIHEDDVILCGFPRSGTTLMQEMIWLIVNDFDFDGAKREITDKRFPLLENHEEVEKFYNGTIRIDLDDMKRPRTIKTHLPVQFLPDDFWRVRPKMIHMSRDVRDVAISSFYFAKHMLHIDLSLDEFLESFLADECVFGPYREHCLDYCRIRDYEGRLNLTYEWVTGNIDEAIKTVAEFLGKDVSEENFGLLKEHLKFDSMKKNDACNNKAFMERMNEITKQNRKPEGFIRKGKAGGYKEEMSKEFIERFDNWINGMSKMTSSFE